MESPYLFQALAQISLFLEIFPTILNAHTHPLATHISSQLYFSSTILWVYTFYLFVVLFHRNVNHIPSTVQDYSIVGGIQNKWTMWYIISGWLSTQTPMLTHYVFWKHLLCTSYVQAWPGIQMGVMWGDSLKESTVEKTKRKCQSGEMLLSILSTLHKGERDTHAWKKREWGYHASSWARWGHTGHSNPLLGLILSGHLELHPAESGTS